MAMTHKVLQVQGLATSDLLFATSCFLLFYPRQGYFRTNDRFLLDTYVLRIPYSSFRLPLVLINLDSDPTPPPETAFQGGTFLCLAGGRSAEATLHMSRSGVGGALGAVGTPCVNTILAKETTPSFSYWHQVGRNGHLTTSPRRRI